VVSFVAMGLLVVVVVLVAMALTVVGAFACAGPCSQLPSRSSTAAPPLFHARAARRLQPAPVASNISPTS
jgi:hypothetical protein